MRRCRAVRRRATVGPIGRSTANRQPPVTLSTAIRPSWDSTTPRAIASPSPAPSLAERDFVAAPADVEHPGQVLLGDPAAAVDDLHPDVSVLRAPARDPDRLARVRVPDRVGHQVRDRSGEVVGGARRTASRSARAGPRADPPRATGPPRPTPTTRP